MIKLLKSNIPLVYAFSILFVLIVSSVVFVQSDIERYNFFSWYSTGLTYLKNNAFADYLFTILLITITGYVINRGVNKTSFYQKTTGFPIVIYLAIISTFGGFYFGTSYCIDLLFALAFLKLIELDQNKSAINVSFVVGIIIGASFLFSYWVIPIALILFFSLQWREWLVALLGMSLPTIYLLSFRYILFNSYSISPKILTAQLQTVYWYDFLSYMLLFIIVFLALIKLRKQFSSISNVERKQINILVFFTVLTLMISGSIYWVYKIEYFIFAVPLTFLVVVPILNSNKDSLMNLLLSSLIILNLLRIFIF